MKKLLLLSITAILSVFVVSAKTFEKVSDFSSLNAGDEIIFIGDWLQVGTSNPHFNVALTTANNSNFGGSLICASTGATSAVGETYELDENSTIIVFTLENSNNSNYPFLLAFDNNGTTKYAKCTSSSSKSSMSNVLKADNQCQVKFDGTDIIFNNSDRNYFQVNVSNGKTGAATFNCYAKGGQKQITIYRAKNEGPVDYVPSFQTLNLKVGDKVNPQPANAPEMTFMTNNNTVVTATDNILEAVGEGSTTIDVMWAASDKWKEGETSFTVNVSKHEYTPEWGDISLSEGDDYQLVLGENHPELLAESDNEEVALIDENGYIIAGTAGTANITVIWGDDKWVDGSAEFTVTVTKPRRDVVLTWSAETANATLGSEFSAPTLSANIEDALAEVVLSSSNTEVAAIEDGDVVIKGAGTATITATIANSTDFNDATASYTLTVVDPNAPQDVTFDFSTKDAYGMKSGADYIYTTVTCEAANGVKIEIIPTAESGNTFRHWSATGGYDLRIYDNSKLVVTAPAGFELAKISFEKGLSKDFSMNASAGTLNTREWTAKDTECIKEVVFTKADKNSTMSSITVSLKACPAETPELTLEGSKVIATPKSADHTIVWRVRPVEGSQSPVMRAVAATDWTSHNVGEVLEHEIQPNEAYYLDVKAMTSNGHESAVNTLLLQNGEVTGIEDVVTEAGEVEYFNLQGIRVVNPENGIFIRRQGGKTSKVAL